MQVWINKLAFFFAQIAAVNKLLIIGKLARAYD